MAKDIGVRPLFDTMIDEQLLEENVFAFYMSLNEDEESELTFGWYDTSKYIGELSWYPVINKFFWTVQLDDIKVTFTNFIIFMYFIANSLIVTHKFNQLNGISLGLDCGGPEHGICLLTPDSGTSTFTFPDYAWQKSKHQFPDHHNCESDKVFGTLTYFILFP